MDEILKGNSSNQFEEYNKEYERKYHQQYYKDLLECVRKNGYFNDEDYINSEELSHINPKFIYNNLPSAKAIFVEEFNYGLLFDQSEEDDEILFDDLGEEVDEELRFAFSQIDRFNFELGFDYESYRNYGEGDCPLSQNEIEEKIDDCFDELVNGVYYLSWRTQEEWSNYSNMNSQFLSDYLGKARLRASLKMYKNNFVEDVFWLEELGYEDEIHLVHNLAHLIALIYETGSSSPELCFGKLGRLSDKWIRDNFAGAFGVIEQYEGFAFGSLNHPSEQEKFPRYTYDERLDLSYKLEDDLYYICCKGRIEDNISPYGALRLKFLKEQRPETYECLVKEGKLYEHLYEINCKVKDAIEKFAFILANGKGIKRGEYARRKTSSMLCSRAEAEKIALEKYVYI